MMDAATAAIRRQNAIRAAAPLMLGACLETREALHDIVARIPCKQEAPYSQALANDTLQWIRVQAELRLEHLNSVIDKAVPLENGP